MWVARREELRPCRVGGANVNAGVSSLRDHGLDAFDDPALKGWATSEKRLRRCGTTEPRLRRSGKRRIGYDGARETRDECRVPALACPVNSGINSPNLRRMASSGPLHSLPIVWMSRRTSSGAKGR